MSKSEQKVIRPLILDHGLPIPDFMVYPIYDHNAWARVLPEEK